MRQSSNTHRVSRLPLAALVALVALLVLPGVSPSLGVHAAPPALVHGSRAPAAPVAVLPTAPTARTAAHIHPAGGARTSVWENITKASVNTPGVGYGREFAGMASDTKDNITLYFGGYSMNSNGQILYPLDNDTWELQNGVWTNITSTAGFAPSPRLDPNLVYDINDGYFLLWGGLYAVKGSGHYDTDTFEFSPISGTWTNLTASVGTAPSGLYLPTMTYDAADKEAVLFSGAVGGSGDLGKGAKAFQETWTYANKVWTNLTTTLGAAQPPARFAAAAAWDGWDNEVVVYGGLKSGVNFFTDTWAFKAGAWTNETALVPTGANNPVGVQRAMMATNVGQGGYVVLFGGLDANASIRNETWVFYNQSWVNVTAYVGLPPPLPGAPFDGGVASGSMCWDGATGQIVLYGGYVYWGGGFSAGTENLTWSYQWINVTTVLSANRTEIPQNQPVVFSATSRGGTFSYTYVYSNDTLGVVNALPPGCTTHIAPSLTCSPTKVGYYNITVTATDGLGTVAKAKDVAIHVFPPFTSLLVISRHAIDYNGQVVLTTSYQGGTGHGIMYTYSGLPPGCANADLPVITCHPKGTGAIGSFNISVKVTDDVNDIAGSSGPVSLTVYPAFTLGLAGGPQGPGKKIVLDAGSTLYLNSTPVGGDNASYAILWTGLPAGCLTNNVTKYTCVPSPATIVNYTIYVVRVFVTDAANVTMNFSLEVQVWPQLQASVSAAPLTGHAPLTVSFFGNVTGGWQPDSAYWLTDGGVEKGAYPNVNFSLTFNYVDNGGPNANVHAIQFWANDTFNASIFQTVTITVLPPVPLLGANITTSPLDAVAEIGETAVFTAVGSGGMAPYTYNWTAFSGCTPSGAQFSCTPLQPGYVYGTVKVTDSLGKSFSPKPSSVDFLPRLTVSLSATPVPSCGAGTVNLSAQPSGGEHPYTVTWTFPDGTTATGAQVSHDFAKTGDNYTITANVTDVLGASVTGTTFVDLTSCGSQGTTGSSFPLLPVAGGLIVLIAVIALLVFLMTRRRGGGGEETEDLAPGAPTATEESPDEGELWGAEQRPPEELSDDGANKNVTPIPSETAPEAADDTWPPKAP